MSLTNDQLLERILKIEDRLTSLETAVNNFTTRREMKQLTNIRQAEIIDLQNRIRNLESQVEALLNPTI